MKKMLAIFAALLLAASLIVLPAAGAETGGIFTMNSVEGVSAGDTVEITLHISGDYEVNGMNLSIEYDPTCMVLESCTQGEYLTRIAALGNVVILDPGTLSNAGMIKLGVICPINAVSGEGDMPTMRFRIKDGVTVNQQVIMVVHEFVYLPLGSMNSTNVPFTTENAVIALSGGSTPDGGYNSGGSGIGDNVSEAPNYPTRDPNDPDSEVTPAVDFTPEPGSTEPANTTVPATDDPNESHQPVGRETPEPTGTDAPETEVPATDEVTPTDKPFPTKAPEEPEDSAAPDSSGTAEAATAEPGDIAPKKSSPVPYIIGGAAVLAAAGAVAAVILNKKKK